MPDPRKGQQQPPENRPGQQQDDNIDDLGRNVTDGEIDKERHPQADKERTGGRGGERSN